MWTVRIGLSFLLVVLMGREIPRIVHNLTPFEAKSVEIKNVFGKFAGSRMIDFFEYQITYDLKVYVEHSYKIELFGIVDTVNNKFQVPLETKENIHPHSFFSQSQNTTITTVSVPPLAMKGLFMIERGRNNYTFGRESFDLVFPGAEPVFNPLLVAVIIIYFLTVLCGFAVEMLTQNQRNSAYSEFKEEGELTFRRREKNWLKLVYWIIVVAVVEAVVIGVAMITGAVPCYFH